MRWNEIYDFFTLLGVVLVWCFRGVSVCATFKWCSVRAQVSDTDRMPVSQAMRGLVNFALSSSSLVREKSEVRVEERDSLACDAELCYKILGGDCRGGDVP